MVTDWLHLSKAFLFGAAVDILWVLWIRMINRDRVLMAGFLSAAMATPAVLGIVTIVENRWAIIPYLLGLFCGTVIAMLLTRSTNSSQT